MELKLAQTTVTSLYKVTTTPFRIVSGEEEFVGSYISVEVVAPFLSTPLKHNYVVWVVSPPNQDELATRVSTLIESIGGKVQSELTLSL